MIEISTQAYGFKTHQFSFDIAVAMLQDGFLRDDDYIEFIMEGGCQAAVRKRDIVSINEKEGIDA